MFLLVLVELPELETPAVDVALPPVALDDAPEVLFDVLVLLGTVGVDGADGGIALCIRIVVR